MRSTRDEEFTAYVDAQAPHLLRTATLLAAGDHHLAEDLVQATLVRLYVAWPRFRSTEHPQAYARRTLTNVLLNERRRLWRRHEQPSPDLPDTAAAASDEQNERADDVRAALAALAPRMRAAIVFRYFHDLSVAETADLLNCSQGTVKSQTARGLERMRTHFDTTAVTRSSTSSDATRDLATPGAFHV